MEPIEEVTMYVCGVCKSVASTPKIAGRCCRCSRCNAERYRGRMFCENCLQEIESEKRQKILDESITVPYNDTMVLHDNSDGFFDTEDAIYCHLTEEYISRAEAPDYFFVSERIIGVKINAEELIENYVEHTHYEGASEYINGVEALQFTLDRWSKFQGNLVSYRSTTKQKVNTDHLIKHLGITWES